MKTWREHGFVALAIGLSGLVGYLLGTSAVHFLAWWALR